MSPPLFVKVPLIPKVVIPQVAPLAPGKNEKCFQQRLNIALAIAQFINSYYLTSIFYISWCWMFVFGSNLY